MTSASSQLFSSWTFNSQVIRLYGGYSTRIRICNWSDICLNVFSYIMYLGKIQLRILHDVINCSKKTISTSFGILNVEVWTETPPRRVTFIVRCDEFVRRLDTMFYRRSLSSCWLQSHHRSLNLLSSPFVCWNSPSNRFCKSSLVRTDWLKASRGHSIPLTLN